MGLVSLNERSYVHCPQCGAAVLFLDGQEHRPETNAIEVVSGTVVTMICPTDGKFEVSAEDFRNDPREGPQI